MTTRILDIAASAQHTADASNPIAELQQVIWLSVLKSVSAYLAYRKLSRVKVSGGRVARFLLEEARFPRTLRYCLNSLVDTIGGLPQPTHPHRLVQQIRKRAAAQLDYQDLGPAFSNEMDRIQRELAELHIAINQTWFAI